LNHNGVGRPGQNSVDICSFLAVASRQQEAEKGIASRTVARVTWQT
jgi:hypothetical protein